MMRWTPCGNQAAIRRAREVRNGAFNLVRVAHVDRGYLQSKGRRHGVDGAELPDPGGYGRISKDGRPRHARRDLLEVALPPGRARQLTKPAPTGSGTTTNTTGIVRVARIK